jgi:hypothetical protein
VATGAEGGGQRGEVGGEEAGDGEGVDDATAAPETRTAAARRVVRARRTAAGPLLRGAIGEEEASGLAGPLWRFVVPGQETEL